MIAQLPRKSEIEFVEKDFPIRNESSLQRKHIIKVSSAFEPVNKVAEPQATYRRKSSTSSD